MNNPSQQLAMKNFIFDLYNTLIDIETDEHTESAWSPVVEFFGARGMKTDWRTLCDGYDRYWKLYMERAVAEREFSFPECDETAIFQSIARSVRGNLSEADAVLASLAMHTAAVKHMYLFDGTVELLKELRSRGCGVYLLSNAQSVIARSSMKQCGLDESLFDGIMISSDERVRKPDPAFFELLFDKYNLDKKSAVMIGDDRTTDIRGANAFGIASVWAGGGAAAHSEEILASAAQE